MAAARGDVNSKGKLRICIFSHDFLKTLVGIQHAVPLHESRGRTVAARAVISINISFPSSSFLGFAVTTVACRVGEVENARHCCKHAILVKPGFESSAGSIVEIKVGQHCGEEGGREHDFPASMLLRLVDSFH